MISRAISKIKEFVFGMGIGGETIRYLIVGGLTTLLNFVIFLLMHDVFGIASIVSNITSISASILFAYVANKIAVFRSRSETREQIAAEFLKFVGSRLFTMALEIGIVELFDSIPDWNATVGKAVSQVFVITVNYFISKIIVFRKK